MPCILSCFFKQKKISYIDWVWTENFGLQNDLISTLVWWISLWNVMIRRWKFHHRLFTTVATYFPNSRQFKSTWREIGFQGFWEVGGLKKVSVKDYMWLLFLSRKNLDKWISIFLNYFSKQKCRINNSRVIPTSTTRGIPLQDVNLACTYTWDNISKIPFTCVGLFMWNMLTESVLVDKLRKYYK